MGVEQREPIFHRMTPLGQHGNKFTPEIKALIMEAVGDRGMTLRAACGHARVSTRTLERWHARAREEAEAHEGGPPGPYTEFFLDLEVVQGHAQSIVETGLWKLAQDGDGPSQRRWLEAHDPAVWGRRGRAVPVAITGDNPQVIVLQEGTSDDPADYFGVESIMTAPVIEAPE